MQKLIAKIFPVDKLKETVLRFPLSVVCSVAIFSFGFLLIHDFIDPDDKGDIIARSFMVLSCSYLWFGIAKLISESLRWDVVKLALISIVGAVAIAALFVFSSLYGIHFAFVLPALLLGIMIAPYLKGGDNHSIWYFNRVVWFGVALSFLASFLLAGGLSLALLAIHFLFKVEIDGEIYADIWLFSSFVLGSVYALSWVPERFEYNKDECKAPPGLSFIANWISVPMVFVYLAILYAYFAKILLAQEVPNGHLAYMITGFAGAGVVTYLVAWLLQGSKEETPQLRLFYRIFPFALFVPIGFHFYAIWERVSAYGITEFRYVLLLSAIWFAIVAISQSLSVKSIKIIPASLCALFALASFGPWGAVSVSGNSQFARLEMLLDRYDLIQGDKIVAAKKGAISKEDRVNISSILDYLCHSKRDEMIVPWFNTENKDNWSCYGGRGLTEKLGFEHIYRYRAAFEDERFSLSPDRSNHMNISGYDILIKGVYASVYKANDYDPWKKDWNVEGSSKVEMEFDRKFLKVSVDSHEVIIINIIDVVKSQIDLESEDQNFIVENENSDLRYKLRINNINGEIINDEPSPSNLSFDFLYRIK